MLILLQAAGWFLLQITAPKLAVIYIDSVWQEAEFPSADVYMSGNELVEFFFFLTFILPVKFH